MNDLPANFARVDDRVWRGSRPDAYQARDLIQAGVRTVIDLEWEESDVGLWPPRAPDSSPVNLVRIRDFEPLPLIAQVQAWFTNAPSLADRHVIAALRAIEDGPAITYLHCRSGEDRSGVATAAYQLITKHMPIEDVIAYFRRFKPFWAFADVAYIRSIAERREWFMAQVAG